MTKITDETNVVKKTEADLRAFMAENPPLDEGGSRLGNLVKDLGINACLKSACEHLLPAYTGLLIKLDADTHQEATYTSVDGTLKTGSLIDLSLASAKMRGEECPEQLLKMLLCRGVEAEKDCTHETVVRYREALSAKYDEAAANKPSLIGLAKEFSARTAVKIQGKLRAAGQKIGLEIN